MTWRGPGKRRRRLRWTAGILTALAVAGALIAATFYFWDRPGVHRPGEALPEITRALARGLPESAPEPRLTDVTVEAGLSLESFFSGPRTSQLPEDMGSGAAWGDFDNDGDEDLFVVSNGGALSLAAGQRAPSRLYENNGDGSFRIAATFPPLHILGMAAAWGDFDGDGWQDLLVTGHNHLSLHRNDAGRFTLQPQPESRPGFWTGASWGDFDGDGDLDLYVCGYVRYEVRDGGRRADSRQYGRNVPYTLNPSSHEPERNLLFRNDGAGTFTEMAAELGVDNRSGRSLGAVWHDFDGDGRLDLYVANDISDNALYMNSGAGFTDRSHAAWVSDYRGAMGMAVGDWNGDGDDDLFITHWVAQENALYDSLLATAPEAETRPAAQEGETQPGLRFVDLADSVGLGQVALHTIGWGTEFADLDADGWLDLVVINGSTFENDEEPPRLRRQRPFLFWNDRGSRFHDLAPQSEPLAQEHVGRGLAVADHDGDGDLDLLIVNHAEGAQLLRNDMSGGNWLQVRLRSVRRPGGAAVCCGEGATVTARVGESVLRRSVTPVSYLSQSSRTVHFGLGAATAVDEMEIHWPGGAIDVHERLAANRIWEMEQGSPSPRPVVAMAASALPRAPDAAEATPTPATSASPASERRRVVAFWEAQRGGMKAMRIDGDLNAAIRSFEKALSLDPRHEDTLYYLGHCHARRGEVDAAMARFQELTRVNPSSHRGHQQWGLLRATSATSADELADAEAALERAFAINPEETGVLLILGEVNLLQRQWAEAEQRLEWACRTNSRAVGGFFLLGHLAWKRGDPDTARDRLTTSRDARGPEWKPEGTTAEGDVQMRAHQNDSLLSRFWERWDGSTDNLDGVFAELDHHLQAGPDDG